MKQFLIDSATSRAVGVERGQIFSGCKVAARSCFLEGRCGTLVPDTPYLELCTWVGSKAASRRQSGLGPPDTEDISFFTAVILVVYDFRGQNSYSVSNKAVVTQRRELLRYCAACRGGRKLCFLLALQLAVSVSLNSSLRDGREDFYWLS